MIPQPDTLAYVYFVQLVEALSITLLLIAFALTLPSACKSILKKLEAIFSWPSKRPAIATLFLFLGTIVIRLAILPLLPVPVPGIHDEFSYLLMADTFLHGRLANPPHPMWMSFETFHVNWSPTYSSMYPPAQGFVLAAGKLLGNPWIGVLLSVALMTASMHWMMRVWLPSRWAFLGAATAAIKLGIASYWMNSYWGGAVAATGGALILGAMPRIAKRANLRDAFILGVGIALLANSRPYEGFLFCIPVGIWFLWWLFGKSRSTDRANIRVRRVLVPVSVVLILTVTFMAYYNWRLTGNPLLFPHTLNVKKYHSAPMFVWNKPGPALQYNNQTFTDFYTYWEREEYSGSWQDFVRVSLLKISRYGTTYFVMGFLLALPGILFLWRDRKIRFLLLTIPVAIFAAFSVVWANPHYISPWTCVFFVLLVQAIRHVRAMNLGPRPAGLALSWAIVALLFVDTGRNLYSHVCDPLNWACQGDPSRVAVIDKLSQLPGKHLVIVHYDKDHNIHDEWVYNGADIDNEKVIWARELTSEQNAKLLAYFKDRQVWFVHPDEDNTELLHYPPPEE